MKHIDVAIEEYFDKNPKSFVVAKALGILFVAVGSLFAFFWILSHLY